MTNTKLIADSGTTKTDWIVLKEDQALQTIRTKGLNPYFQSYESIREELEQTLLPQLKESDIDAVYFYGAGCVFDKVDLMCEAIATALSPQEINVYTDLLAAAHSTCGDEACIACILGTGSNSCFYDGKEIVKNIPPLGYILGDEGGAAMMGRMLASDVLKEILPKPLRDAFYERFQLTQADILEHVYRKPYPNRFLASLSPFLQEHKDTPEIHQLITNSFTSFLSRNVMQYDYRKYPAHFVGSIAHYYKEILTETASTLGVHVGKITQAPIEGLVEYYKNR